MTGVSIVIPTLGRPSLTTLLTALTPAPAATGPAATPATVHAGTPGSIADTADGSGVHAGAAADGDSAARAGAGMLVGAARTALPGRTPPAELTGLAGRSALPGRAPAPDRTGLVTDRTGPAADRTGPAADRTGPAADRTGPAAEGSGLATHAGRTRMPVEIVIVDDRADRGAPLPVPAGVTVTVLPGRAAGPAAARNVGWRAARHEWVAFLDDDVIPEPGWLDALVDDLAGAPDEVGGVQGGLRVPLPDDRRPTDWERGTAALADGRWITADMAYRRRVLDLVGGFDERLPRAFREDAELAYRVRDAGWDLIRGARIVTHPVREEDRWVSVRRQRGNADDALLRRLYGRDWRYLLEIPPGRRARHAGVTAAGAVALLALAARRPRVAAVAGAAWAAGTAEFAAARIAPGPRTAREITTMAVTSAVIPPAAVTWWLRGWTRWRGARPLARRPLEPTR
ncbi:glycosyltransferase family 2 protein [Catenuloplanes atrovinosus]|uniref:Glycosyltransferase involved in cell wall biosynthesis n=1 Tax=Catenuloplanes atrovinosus TaxID=137266 RepID=A0AAE3YLB7_9ACTN|nr:glycosyltransferase [Catenuloplanes atrovinosus]MDR7274323.1 glycosyltransferase involved in cell wall biosynthesis [Catenuloplanes atrovinosus]